jgi:Golgi SNAP receptor complex protein 2
METIYGNSSSLVEQIQDKLFPRLEQANLSRDTAAAVLIETEIENRLRQLEASFERLDVCVSKEPPNRRPEAKMRVDQLKYDARHLSAAHRNLKQRRIAKEQEERERDELLTRRFTTNASASAGDTAIAMEHMQRENNSLSSAHRGVDELLSSGGSILGGLRDQRETLKGAHRKILEISNSLGMSNTVMRLIEKRAFKDRVILFSGMTLFSLFMILVYVYVL